MSDYKNQIIKLELEMKLKIAKIKDEYSTLIDDLKIKMKQQSKDIVNNKLQSYSIVDVKTEFNSWWQLYLKLYKTIYKDNNNKYYYYDEEEIKEIKIINTYIGNINNVRYLRNIKHNRFKLYTYMLMIFQLIHTYIITIFGRKCKYIINRLYFIYQLIVGKLPFVSSNVTIYPLFL